MSHTHYNGTPGCLRLFSSGRRCRDAALLKFQVRPRDVTTPRTSMSNDRLVSYRSVRNFETRSDVTDYVTETCWKAGDVSDGLSQVFTYLFVYKVSVSNQENKGVYLQRFCMFSLTYV